jgi:hypothetical protein
VVGYRAGLVTREENSERLEADYSADHDCVETKPVANFERQRAQG